MYIYTANIDLYLFFKQYLYTSQTLKNQNKSEAIKKTVFLKNKDLYIYSTDIPKTTFVSFSLCLNRCALKNFQVQSNSIQNVTQYFLMI